MKAKIIKPICYGYYTEADRGFRKCYVCEYQYPCIKKSGASSPRGEEE